MIMKRTRNMKRSMNIKRDNKTISWIWKQPWIHDYEKNHTEEKSHEYMIMKNKKYMNMKI